ncbi:major facilitator superfamily multidrug-resistance, DHA1 sub-family [Mycena metata]|uniref:Major facilitator superfamily multidrug-resistance, DHA1 sub-family n=1 Tax=Mycena metata TaxID=1033252 RepID=A0AAD7INP6_9AGAR|nr:major facilitator superfamily multidrug-resistance, DHA1 sub-family [Mycena metata]
MDGDRNVARRRAPFPKVQVAIVFLIQFSEPITALVIYPFVVQFVRDTGITGGEESKTGFYAGFLESAFFLTESLSVFPLGRLSDTYGRRPVLLWGPLGLGLSMLGFGLSKSFWTLLFFRCIQGVCNGGIGSFCSPGLSIPLHNSAPQGVSKTVINEIADPTNIADIFSMMPLIWSIGTTVAPLLGGLLANPATKWPATFGRLEIFRIHAYFAPCLVAGLIALISFAFAFVGLNETLPSIVARRAKSNAPAVETDPLIPTPPHDAPPPIRDLLIRPVFIALANHGILAFVHMANEALIPLVFATPIGAGLGLNPNEIGIILGIRGACNVVVQLLFAGPLIRRYGPRRIVIAGSIASLIQFSLYPIVGVLARRAAGVDAAVYIVLACQLSCAFVVYFAYAGMMIFIMDAAPGPASLGSVNGLAQMVGTVLRSLAPSFSSSLFALSVEHHFAAGNMVYFALMAVTLGALCCSLLLPRTLRSEVKA